VPDSISIRSELKRKSIHLSTAVLPLAYFIGVQKNSILITSFFLFGGFLIVDLLRMYFPLARKYFLRVFSPLLREEEKQNRLTGATYLFAGMSLSFYLFDKESAVAAVLFLCLADPMAAIIGRVYGNRRFAGKSLQGSSAFLLVALAIVFMIFRPGWPSSGIAVIATVVEFLPVPVNDNLSIPLISGLLLQTFV